MEKDKFLEAISNHLEDIREQFEIIRGYEGKIPSIELDLVMSNIRKVYEAFVKLEKLNQPVVSFSVEKKQEKGPAAAPEVPVEEKKEQPPAEKAVEEARPADTVPEVQPEAQPEVQPEAQPEVEKEKEVETPVAEQEEEKEEPKQPKTTLDLFGESSSTLADRLTDNTEKRVADKLKVEKIKDIRSAVGINEKFLFINELFDGSLKNYEDAVSRLNQCASGAEAGQILDEFQANYRWDRDDPTTLTFMDLVRRRF